MSSRDRQRVVGSDGNTNPPPTASAWLLLRRQQPATIEAVGE